MAMASEEGKTEGKGFTVQDRRRFSPETGEARPESTESPTATEPASAPSEAQDSPTHEASSQPLPEINYSTFVISLSTCLLYTSDAADERSSVDLGGRRI